MAGGSINCGTFSGEDKSGSAFQGVIDAIQNGAKSKDIEVVEAIQASLDQASEYILIPEHEARKLLPLLVAYRRSLVAEIGHEDWVKEAQAEEEAGMDSIQAKWGAGRGWRLYCTTDLITACETSIAEHEPILVSFS